MLGSRDNSKDFIENDAVNASNTIQNDDFKTLSEYTSKNINLIQDHSENQINSKLQASKIIGESSEQVRSSEKKKKSNIGVCKPVLNNVQKKADAFNRYDLKYTTKLLGSQSTDLRKQCEKNFDKSLVKIKGSQICPTQAQELMHELCCRKINTVDNKTENICALPFHQSQQPVRFNREKHSKSPSPITNLSHSGQKYCLLQHKILHDPLSQYSSTPAVYSNVLSKDCKEIITNKLQKPCQQICTNSLEKGSSIRKLNPKEALNHTKLNIDSYVQYSKSLLSFKNTNSKISCLPGVKVKSYEQITSHVMLQPQVPKYSSEILYHEKQQYFDKNFRQIELSNFLQVQRNSQIELNSQYKNYLQFTPKVEFDGKMDFKIHNDSINENSERLCNELEYPDYYKEWEDESDENSLTEITFPNSTESEETGDTHVLYSSRESPIPELKNMPEEFVKSNCNCNPILDSGELNFGQPLILKYIDDDTHEVSDMLIFTKEFIENLKSKQSKDITPNEILAKILENSRTYEGEPLCIIFNINNAVENIRRVNNIMTGICNIYENAEEYFSHNKGVNCKRETKQLSRIPELRKTAPKPDCKETTALNNRPPFRFYVSKISYKALDFKRSTLNNKDSTKNRSINSDYIFSKDQIYNQNEKPPAFKKSAKLKIRMKKNKYSRTASKRVNIDEIVTPSFNRYFRRYSKKGSYLKSGAVITKTNSSYWLTKAGIATDDKSQNAINEIFTTIARCKLVLNIYDYIYYLAAIARNKKMTIKELIKQLMVCKPPPIVRKKKSRKDTVEVNL